MAGRGPSPKGTASSAWRSFLKSTAPSGATSTGARVALLVTTIRIAEQQGTHVAASEGGLASSAHRSRRCASTSWGHASVGGEAETSLPLIIAYPPTAGQPWALSSPSPGGGRLYAPPAAAVREIEAARGRGEADRAVVEHGRPTGARDAQRQAAPPPCASAPYQPRVPVPGRVVALPP